MEENQNRIWAAIMAQYEREQDGERILAQVDFNNRRKFGKKIFALLVSLALSAAIFGQPLMYADINGGFDFQKMDVLVNLDAGLKFENNVSLEANLTASFLDHTNRAGASIGYQIRDRNTEWASFRPYIGITYGRFLKMVDEEKDYLKNESRLVAGLKIQHNLATFDIRAVANDFSYSHKVYTLYFGIGCSIVDLINYL